MKDLLVISNGAGEDAIANRIFGYLEAARIEVLPVVGLGQGYKTRFQRVGPRRVFPSQGLVQESKGALWADLRAGLIGHHLAQVRYLASVRSEYRGFVAVGDLFPVILAGLAGCRPLYFVGTAKSVYHHPYSWVERFLLNLWVSWSLVRDQPTADSLKKASFLGNAMMDELNPRGIRVDCPLVLFPGSRERAYEDFPLLVEAYQLIEQPGSVALAPSIEPERLAQACGWEWSPDPDFLTEESGLVGELRKQGYPPMKLYRGVLGDQLRDARVALGQAGTANEQAAGAGVPVVAYAPGGESALGWYRGRQKGLLGDALRVVEPDARQLAAEVKRLFQDPCEWERRAGEGRRRMGPGGGAERMASFFAERLGLP